MKKEELGAIRKRFSCPEKYSTQAPLWKDILFNLIPVLIVGFMIASLANGAGMSAAGAYLVGALVTAGFTFFSVFVTRAWKKRYEESYMTLQEKGISGVCPVNAFHSKEFAVAYNEIRNVTVKKDRMTLDTAAGRIVLFAEEADAVAEELRKLRT